MPLLVNSRVGSLPGTSEAEGTIVCPRAAKKSRNSRRIAETFMGRRGPAAASGTPSIQNRHASTGVVPAASGSCVRLGARAAEKAQDRRQGEAARLKETHLARFLALVLGSFSESSLPQRSQRRVVVDAASGQRCLDVVARDAPRLQLAGDAPAAVTSRFLPGERAGVARIGKVAARGQLVERGAHLGAFPAFRDELLLQLRARILAAREQPDGLSEQRRLSHSLAASLVRRSGAARRARHGHADRGANPGFDLGGELRMLAEVVARVVLALPDALALVGVPRARFLDHVLRDAELDHL